MILLFPLTQRAAAQGVPVAERFMLDDETPIDFEVTAEGAVRVLTPGWMAVLDHAGNSGSILEFRPLPVDPFTVADQGIITMIEMLRRFTRNGATIAEGAALTVAFLRDARNQPQEET